MKEFRIDIPEAKPRSRGDEPDAAKVRIASLPKTPLTRG